MLGASYVVHFAPDLSGETQTDLDKVGSWKRQRRLQTLGSCQEFSFYSVLPSYAFREGNTTLATLVDLTVWLLALTACVNYLVVVGDAAEQLFGANRAQRSLALCVVTVCVLLPLSLPKRLHSLRFTSVLGVVAVLYACAFLSFIGLSRCVEGEVPPESPKLRTYAVSPWRSLLLLGRSFAVFNACFCAHTNAVQYFGEMRKRTVKQFSKVAVCAFSFVFLIYALVGGIGASCFRHQRDPADTAKGTTMTLHMLRATHGVPSNILGALDAEVRSGELAGGVVIALRVAQVGMCLCVLFTYPLVMAGVKMTTHSCLLFCASCCHAQRMARMQHFLRTREGNAIVTLTLVSVTLLL
ncbi:MAG: hypothetical protein MHM6MM_006089 [Cercozoa sp. M6MM]